MNKYLAEFENHINLKIRKDFFVELYDHAKDSPMFNSLSDRARKYFYNLFIPSRGKLPLAMNKLFQNFAINKLSLEKSVNDQKLSIIKENLNHKGFHVLPNFFSDDQVEKIREELGNFKYVCNNNEKIFGRLSEIKNKNDYKNHPMFFSSLQGENIEENKTLFQIFENKFFLDIAENYFGIKSYLNHAISFYTNPINYDKYYNDDKNKSHNAQSYHYDYSHLRFLKFFIYLSDVEEPENGAHTFISKSHEENLIIPKNLEDYEETSLRYFSDGSYGGMIIKEDWINKNIDSNRIMRMCYPKGTVIIENTTGLHKGNRCLKGHREMLSLIYSISNLCPLTPNKTMTLKIKNKRDISDFLTYNLSDYKMKHLNIYNSSNSFLKRLKNKLMSLFY